MYTLPKIERFNQNVLSKYHIYNSVFITLPFDAIDNTGVLLPLFSEVWQIIFDEFSETKRLLLKLAGHKELMENYSDGKASIAMREQIVMPLLAIQQYASSQINEMKKNNVVDTKLVSVYEKLVMRSLFGNTNASRNSA